MIEFKTALPPGMEFDWEGNLRYKKSWYQVYECTDPVDHWSLSGKCLFEHDNLAHAHGYAYEEWKRHNKKKIFTIIQAVDGSCRGGYGFAEEEA